MDVENWLWQNGKNLGGVDGQEWVCLFIPGLDSIKTAKICHYLGMAYYLPLSFDSKRKKYIPIWQSYIFVRTSKNDLKILKTKIKPQKILHTAQQRLLISQLKLTPPFSKIEKQFKNSIHPSIPNFQHGMPVLFESGALKGAIGCISMLERIQNGMVGVSYEMLGNIHHVTMDWKQIRPIEPHEQIEIIKEFKPTVIQQEIKQLINIETSVINEELIKYLSNHPNLLYELHPRRFEELVAEILADMGYKITLTPATRDGGVDILAVMPTPIGEVLTVVECKRYKATNTVGIEYVERFMYSIREKFKASFGLMATTSSFSPEAKMTQQAYQWQLQLKDFEAIKGWLSDYGQWKKTEEAGIWIPQRCNVHV